MASNENAPMSDIDQADQDIGASKNLKKYNSIPAPKSQCLIKIDASIARLDFMINRLRQHVEVKS